MTHLTIIAGFEVLNENEEIITYIFCEFPKLCFLKNAVYMWAKAHVEGSFNIF